MPRYFSGRMSLLHGEGRQFESVTRYQIMESNAAGLVLRPALKTGFSEMGWGSTPLLSAKLCVFSKMDITVGYEPTSGSSILSGRTKIRKMGRTVMQQFAKL